LKGLVCQLRLVNPLGNYIPSLQIYVCGSFKEHGGNLALDVQLEASMELYHKGPGLNRKNASVCLLAKEVLRLLYSSSILEEDKGLEDFFLITAELLRGQVLQVAQGIGYTQGVFVESDIFLGVEHSEGWSLSVEGDLRVAVH